MFDFFKKSPRLMKKEEAFDTLISTIREMSMALSPNFWGEFRLFSESAIDLVEGHKAFPEALRHDLEKPGNKRWYAVLVILFDETLAKEPHVLGTKEKLERFIKAADRLSEKTDIKESKKYQSLKAVARSLGCLSETASPKSPASSRLSPDSSPKAK